MRFLSIKRGQSAIAFILATLRRAGFAMLLSLREKRDHRRQQQSSPSHVARPRRRVPMNDDTHPKRCGR